MTGPEPSLPQVRALVYRFCMRTFVKFFWGPADPEWPIISFSNRGSLTSLLEKSEPGNLMAFACTQGGETPHEWQGKIVGLAEFSKTIRPSKELLPAKSYLAAEKGMNGDIKWPWAVAVTRAWLFSNPLPVTSEIYGNRLPMSAISNAVRLSDEQQAKLLSQRRAEIDMATTEAVWEERAAILKIVGKGGTMGPIPSSFTTTMARNALRAASTYVLRFGSRDLWKVGWPHDPVARRDELNSHIPSEVLGESWLDWNTEAWPSASDAYAMERRVLESFAPEVVTRERVRCTEAQMHAAWEHRKPKP